MLKWTVVKRDTFPHLDTARRSSMGGCTTAAPAVSLGSAQKTKRRRVSTGRRRSSTGGNRRRNSLCLDLNKENRFTSTPIKDECFQADAFRDVSNLSPKDATRSDRRRAECKKSLYSPKKKKPCLENAHVSEDFLLNLDNTNYFKPFEAVDSHIEGSYHPLANKEAITVGLTDCGCQYSKTPVSKRYAPTLPTFALDYSPTPVVCNTTLCQPKIDHVNDFLQRISMITSSEELKLKLPGYRPKPKTKVSNAMETPSLVKRYIDARRTNANDSSFINDLSLDKIVDAILDSSSSEPSGSESLQTDFRCNDEEEESTCNRLKENNLNNAQQGQSSNTSTTSRTSGSSIITNSTDSGFRSSTTELYHDNVSISSKKTVSTADTEIFEEPTMINLEGTFNERSVDIVSRKRSNDEILYKNEEPQLKRQKCIRQRKIRKLNFGDTESETSESINDHSFSSDGSESIAEEENATYVVASPEIVKSTSNLDNIRKQFREVEAPEETQDCRGTIDLDVQYKQNENELSISVFRCASLKRQNGQPVNAYIKVALGERYSDGRRKHGADGGKRGASLQRTAVQPESTTPLFGHTFRVPLPRHPEPAMLYVEAWHRDRSTRRSEFLGCASFAIKDAITKSIKGTYKLLPQWSDESAPNITCNNNNNLLLTPPALHEDKMTDALHTSIDELIAAEPGAADTGGADQKKIKAALSEQQKVADENLFLRYLELDPIEGPEAAPALTQRKASGNKTTGRTPFTMSRVLRRAPKSGFGFSVVWTHPPRIERVERNLPADKAGIQPGDYLIFVDKHNVVMMPEIEILDLIRSQGNTLSLETFRRDSNRNGSVPHTEKPIQTRTIAQIERLERADSVSTTSAIPLGSTTALALGSTTGLPMIASSLTSVAATSVPPTAPRRPSTVCSTNTASVEYSRKKLHLPQVTFSSERPTTSIEEARRKAMYQLIAREQQYSTSMQFAITRYVQSLLERKDLISQQEHRILFQNCEELLRISEEVIDHLIQVDGDYHTGSLIKIYASKLNEIAVAYKRYCSGIKKADCVLANLMKNPEFSRFITTPAIPRRRPDLTSFIHKPLEHYREILKLFNVILTHTKPNQSEEYNLVNHIVHELQTSYREITSQAGLMEPVGEGRPLLSVQDLETRLVFTKCKPFVLSKPGRQWIFGGDLSRVEGRTVRQYWALLFSDILLFAKVSRDRVLFILEEPLPLAHISDMYFNIRKKENEFRIVVEPGASTGNRNTAASSPTVHCGPDLSRTPRKCPNKRCIILRTPTVELKAVWQNLLQRQIFHIGASAGDGSAYSSPLESPDCCQPITASVVTLQSAESLSRHHPHHATPPLSSLRSQPPQGPLGQTHQQGHTINNNNMNYNELERRKRIDELIEHKCKQLEKSSSSSKSNAIHLEQWMKGQFNDSTNNNSIKGQSDDTDNYDDFDEEDDIETWTEEQIQKRSEELKLVDTGRYSTPSMKRTESRCEDLVVDDDQSPSRSTNTTESQVTVRSSAVVPEPVSVCKNCHRTCYNQSPTQMANGFKRTAPATQDTQEDDNDDWRPLMLMGLSAVNPAISLVKLDPFALPVPKIAVLPPTPAPTPTDHNISTENLVQSTDCNCNCSAGNTKSFDLPLSKEYDTSPDDSPVNEADEQPYHSLHSSNLTLRRFGTVSSLERVGSEEDAYDVNSENSEENDIRTTELTGMDNEGFNSTLMTWTAKAGSFVAAKMAFLEKLPDYLKNDMVNGEEIQEEETSGGTSGEEVWGTPTSGGDLDDPLSSPQDYEHQSPNGGSLSSNEDTELMMDELLMTPPVTSSNIRGLLPRRTLEPLMEEEFSDTYTTSESSASSSPTPTEPSVSPEQGNGTGGAADECLSAAATPLPPSSTTNARVVRDGVPRSSSGSGTRLGVASLRSTSTTPPANARTSIVKTATTLAVVKRLKCSSNSPGCDNNSDATSNSGAISPCPAAAEMENTAVQSPVPISIKRSDSYQKIIEAADDNIGFFTRFRNRPSMKYLNIERIPPSRGVKFLEFFNVRRERKIYETFPGGKHLIKVFSREGDDSDDVPTSYSENPELQQRIKQERQLDRRFWKQLSKRRNSNSPNRQTNSTTSSNFSPSPVLASAKHKISSPTLTKKTKLVQPLSA